MYYKNTWTSKIKKFPSKTVVDKDKNPIVEKIYFFSNAELNKELSQIIEKSFQKNRNRFKKPHITGK